MLLSQHELLLLSNKKRIHSFDTFGVHLINGKLGKQ